MNINNMLILKAFCAGSSPSAHHPGAGGLDLHRSSDAFNVRLGGAVNPRGVHLEHLLHAVSEVLRAPQGKFQGGREKAIERR